MRDNLSGILLMNKPAGFTSHDVVAKLRGILHMRKIGHGGTLDPLATGVLPVFLGGATKAADAAAAQDKTYVAGFTLGFSTDTQDIDGAVLQTSRKTASQTDVEEILRRFLGKQRQIPPMYSAVKINGKKLYELARKGKEIDRPPREINVLELTLLSFDPETQKGLLRCTVSKGTYVRTLIHDIGEALGTKACMDSLLRERAGQFTIENCHTFAEVEQAANNDAIDTLVTPTDRLFTQYPAVFLSQEGAERAARGAVIFPRMAEGLEQVSSGALCRVYHENRFLMLGQTRPLNIGGFGLFVYQNF